MPRRRASPTGPTARWTPPHFIKCDVEGAELLVSRGARGVLARADAPIVLFEVNRHTAEGFGVPTPAAKDFLAGLPLPRCRFFAVRGTGGLARLDAAFPGAMCWPSRRRR